MGLLAFLSLIGFIICFVGIFFNETKRQRKGAIIAVIVFAFIIPASIFLEVYSKNHPVITVETYKAFSIEVGLTKIVFDEAMFIEKTRTNYRYGTIFYNDRLNFSVKPLEE